MVNFREFVSSGEAKKPHYMVVGHPISHSLSPLMHRLALKFHNMAAGYLAVDLDPADTDRFISWITRDEFLGANLTIPYKQTFLPVVDRLDPTALEVGALNTIVRKNGMLTGYNTDVDGFRQPLEPHRRRLEGRPVIVFGTGGASRAVIHALRQLGAGQVILVSRSPGSGKQDDVVYCSYQNWQSCAGEVVLLVNTTPLGMFPDLGSSPVAEGDGSLLAGKICYDLVYNPLKTTFLRQAEKEGAETISGLEMFIGQGSRAFELWTGKKFPESEIRQALMHKLT